MKKDDKASISLKKVIGVSVILLFTMGITVFAVNSKVTNVKIILSNGYEMAVLTSKTKVSEILDENHIILLPNELVTPSLDKDISDNKTIRISENNSDVQIISEEIQTIEDSTEQNIENSSQITVEKLLEENYGCIVEKIVTEQIVIPYETTTKDVSRETGNKREVIVSKGIDGFKKVTSKIKYKNDVEIEKVVMSEEIIKEPVTKVVEIRDAVVTSRNSEVRVPTTNPAETASTELAKRVEGITPTVRTMNTSGYCACVSCCGKTNAVTASGEVAAEWYTIAAGRGYAIGTVIYIPYFANMPNGGWFVVQDRGGAISNSSIDVFFGSHSAALTFGRKNLECYIYEL